MSNEQNHPQEGQPLTAEEFCIKMAGEQTAATPDLPVHGTECGFAIRCAKEYAAQQTTPLREELKEETIQKINGLMEIKDLKEELEAVKKERDKYKNLFNQQPESIEHAELRESLSEVTRQRDEAKREWQEMFDELKISIDQHNIMVKVADAGFNQRDEAMKLLKEIKKDYSATSQWRKEVEALEARLSSGETKPVSPVGSNTLNVLAVLSTLSPARSKAAFGLGVDEWSLPEWACALAGEVGELCNFIKKTNRDGLDRTEDIAKEAADVAIYLDLLCTRAGIDLQAAIVSKFNEVSDRMNCDIKFPAPPESLTDKSKV